MKSSSWPGCDAVALRGAAPRSRSCARLDVARGGGSTDDHVDLPMVARRRAASSGGRDGHDTRRPGPGPTRSRPCGSSTPITLNGKFLMRIVSPIGFCSPRRGCRRRSAPSTATLRAPRTRASSKKLPVDDRPVADRRLVGVDALDLRAPVEVAGDDLRRRRARRRTYATDGHSRAMASTSSSVSVGCCPKPMRTPPDGRPPGKTMRRFVPSARICAWTARLGARPTRPSRSPRRRR